VSDTLLTPLHKSHLDLTIWFLAAWMVTTTNGLSSVVLARQIGKSQSTAYSVLERLRAVMVSLLGNPLTGVVEADEMFLGHRQHEATIEVLAEARPDGRVRTVKLFRSQVFSVISGGFPQKTLDGGWASTILQATS